MTRRLHIEVRGCVQGVGFRPAVHRHANAAGLGGWVLNSDAGVIIEVEGERAALDAFVAALRAHPPPMARIDEFVAVETAPCGDTAFAIQPSRHSGDIAAGMPPDLATCESCRAELFAPGDRRCGYPFLNCVDCGPRFTIIDALPYDRERTAMAGFTMCPECRREYETPGDRRFDAQPNACPVCGPRLTLRRPGGPAAGGDPLSSALALLRSGHILAVKGLGGFHLCCDAAAPTAVARLRERKQRPHKPLAVMFRDLDEVAQHCLVTAAAAAALVSAARPIVVLPRRPDSGLSPLLSPDTDDLGAFLPYTPLHHLLLAAQSPLVMTSCNRSEEPIAADLGELGNLLGNVADAALDHDRPIRRRCDDSVMKLCGDRPLLLRRSRGHVPQPLPLPAAGPAVLACGADGKNTFCVTRDRVAFLSQHIGDLDELRAHLFYREAVADLLRLLRVVPGAVACDLHPDYLSTRFAVASGVAPRVAVQHHHAHIAAVLGDHGLAGPVLGIALDGTGYGPDGTVWGGEFLRVTPGAFHRLGHFRQLPMPGGEAAIREPARMAFAWLHAVLPPETARQHALHLLPHLAPGDLRVLEQLLTQRLRTPLTSSAGRLWDAVSALLGHDAPITYEGQAAIRLQTLAQRHGPAAPYPSEVSVQPDGTVLSFDAMLPALLADLGQGRTREELAARVHATLAAGIVTTAVRLGADHALDTVALSGGVFQNELLLSAVLAGLETAGLRVYVPRRVGLNDSCIAYGQAVVAAARLTGA